MKSLIPKIGICLVWLFTIISVLALAVTLSGCKSYTDQAAEQNAALHQQLDEIRQKATAADAHIDKASVADGVVWSEYVQFANDVAAGKYGTGANPTQPSQRAKDAHQQSQDEHDAAKKALAATSKPIEQARKAGDDLQKTTVAAVKDKNSPLKKKIDWMWIIGGCLIVAGAIWWFEGGKYSIFVIFGGIGMVGTAIALGWALDHQGLLLICFAGFVIAVIAIEWIKNPESGWGSGIAGWIWSSWGKAKTEVGEAAQKVLTPIAATPATDVKAVQQ